MRCIDADELKLHIYEDDYDTSNEYEITIQNIDNAPSLNVQSIKYGKWLLPKSNLDGISRTYVCSKCKALVEVAHYCFDCYYIYCPYCGAKNK